MANMKVTYFNKKSGHGNMGDRHTFIKCPECGAKYVMEKQPHCPVCAGEGVDPEITKAIFKKAEEKAAKKSKAKKDADIQAEVDAENAEEEKSKK